MKSSSFIIPEIRASGLARNFEPPPVSVIGAYSNDSKGNYIDGTENLKYVQLFEGTKRVNYNLNEGIDYGKHREYEENIIPKTKEQKAELVELLEWINLHKQEFLRSRPDFVLLRGLMIKIITTPYRCRYNESWRVEAIKKNGTIYFRTALRKEHLVRETDGFLIKTSLWGHNFQKFILADEPNEEPDPRKEEALGTGCHVILKTKITGGHSILYSAKLVGVGAKEDYNLLEINPKENLDMLNNCNMVEVKTCSKTQQNKYRHDGFRRHKSRLWWIEAALAGVSHLVVGYRDDETGIVEDVENIPMKDLYNKYRLGWFGDCGYKFLEGFLSQVKQRVVEDETVYVFSFDKNDQFGQDFEVKLEVPYQESQYLLPNLL